MASPTIPATMCAWTVQRAGPARRALTLERAKPTPALSAVTGANILVRVHYAALNPADGLLMAALPPWLPFRRRPTPGIDFAGVVVAAGPAVSVDGENAVKVGDAVAGALNVLTIAFGTGALAEYIVVPASIVAVVAPGDGKLSLPLGQAAGAFGVAGQTAALVLGEAGVQRGQRVLVNGASGGVGTVLVQALKGAGAEVWGVCSAANEALVKRLGADHVSGTSWWQWWWWWWW